MLPALQGVSASDQPADHYSRREVARQSAKKYRRSRDKYTRGFDPGPDEVIRCRLCGERLKFMGTHLVRRHGITAAEYRERFPRSPTISPETRAMYRETALDRHETEVPLALGTRGETSIGEGWTRKTAVTAIQEFARRRKRPPTYNEWRRSATGRPTASMVAQLFGTFNAGLDAASLPTRSRGTPRGRRRKRCKRGHLLTEENRVEVRPGIYRCRKCLTEYQRKYQRERMRRVRAERRVKTA